MNTLARLLTLLPTFLLGGCYGMTLDEFDSVARWDDPLQEPSIVNWSANPSQYSWYSVFIGTDSVPAEEENPAGFARERLDDLVDSMGNDLSRIAQVARRLLWVSEKDPSALNRISAVRGMERILRTFDASVLDPAAYSRVDAAKGIELLARLRAAHDAIETLHGRADRGTLTAPQRARYVSALRDYTALPVPRPEWRRELIRTTWTVFVVESDPEVQRAARQALRRSIYFAVCNGLRTALVPLDEDDLPAVRIEALYTFRRLGGIDAMPFVFRMMARPKLGPSERRYDRDRKVRMALVRICAQLNFEHASKGDPKPLEYLYETAADEDEESDIRRVALEGLGRCLHEKLGMRRISLERDWADEWWKQYITERGR
jgi:hypothetical protein